jgi:predicted NBD/HSP70 family sugar kinase
VARPSSVRYINEVHTLDLLLRNGGASRADVAKSLGVSRSTITSIVGLLLKQELVRERPRPSPAGGERRDATGRPGIQIELNGSGAYFVGAEVGVHRLTTVVLNLRGEMIAKRSRTFSPGAAGGLSAVTAVLDEIDKAVGDAVDPARIRGVGVSIPALVDHAGVVCNAPIIGWRDVPLKRLMQEALTEHGFKVEVDVLNDASALAIAETRAGTGKRAKTVLFMNMEDGVGGAIVDSERLFLGNDGLAGEIGHLPVGPVEPDYPSGRPFELLVGQEALLSTFARRGCACATIEEASAAIAANNRAAVTAAEEWADHLSAGLLALTYAFNPGLIVLGGVVSELYTAMAPRIRTRLEKELVAGLRLPDIDRSALGRFGSAVGAATVLHQRVFVIDERLLQFSSAQAG